jgi:hypothetical protein
VPLQDALASTSPALLIAADGWKNDRIVLPVGTGANGTLDVQRLAGDGGATTLQLDPGQQFGSLQTVVDGGRILLIATSNGAAAQLDSLLDWLDQDRARWSRLSGTAVVAAPDREPVSVDSNAPPAASAEPAKTESPPWVWLAVGAAAVVAAFAAALFLILRRRRAAGS